MQPIIYDVAVSADGFICGASEDVSLFPHSGPVVDDYLERMATYASALMGRRAYEFGYAHGLPPGANPYPHMESFVFSASLRLPETSDVTLVQEDALRKLDEIQAASNGPIYLCGGGEFAGWLLSERRITTLRLKRAPILYGSGVRLFGPIPDPVEMKLTQSKLYDDGVLFQEFDLSA